MPRKEGHVYCVNHPDERMIRNEGFNALIKVDHHENKVQFNSSTGVPVVVFFCDKCGYIEVYAAQKTPYWQQSVIEDMRAVAEEESLL